jgi:DNA-binding LacI/PurR family transcriptional regulator
VTADTLAPICSRAGCVSPATASVVWRNPRIHDETRRKIWLACDEHRDYLRDYLLARDFPVEVVDGVGTGGAA